MPGVRTSLVASGTSLRPRTAEHAPYLGVSHVRPKAAPRARLIGGVAPVGYELLAVAATRAYSRKLKAAWKSGSRFVLRERAAVSAGLGGDRSDSMEEPAVRAPLRVLIVDDLATARFVVRAYLGSADDIEVVGVADSGEDAVDRVAELKPDVVVMDVEMPGMGGIEATKRIRRAFPTVHVVGFCYCEDESLDPLMRQVGASSFVPKGSPLARLLKTIRDVAAPGNTTENPATRKG